MEQNSIQHYDPSVGEDYIRLNIAGRIITPYERDIIRSINVLSEYQGTGIISIRHCKHFNPELKGSIGLLMDKFLLHLESLRRSNETISDHRLYLSRFLFFLDGKQVSTIEKVKEEHILFFVSTQTNCQIGIVSTVRYFFRFLYDEHITQSDLSIVLQHHKWVKREKLPSVYTTKEVFQIESSISREGATGKRNYAMTLLASRLELRASDIAQLSFVSTRASTYCNKRRCSLTLLPNI
jgi:hypothetical protein